VQIRCQRDDLRAVVVELRRQVVRVLGEAAAELALLGERLIESIE